MDGKRVFDLLVSLAALIILTPLFLVVAFFVLLDSKGSILYTQERVGKDKALFKLLKFRTMYTNADCKGLLTVGNHDSRITKTGYWLRKYKIDELPQLFNILKGEMSFVGPRPEVSKYVALYNPEQQRVLTVKPGITDWASIAYINEDELLATAADPESFYTRIIIPKKISYGLRYIDHKNIWVDLRIIVLTLKCILFKKQ